MSSNATATVVRTGSGTRFVIYTLLALFSLFYLLPLYVMVVNSLKPLSEIQAGGMMALPTTDWVTDDKHVHPEYLAEIKPLSHSAHHTFTHFDLELRLHHAILSDDTPAPNSMFWDVADNKAGDLPTVFKKAFDLFVQQS